MSVRRADTFIADIERQFEWYAVHAGWGVAERYLKAVEANCNLLGTYPSLGFPIRSTHPRLRGWRSFVVSRPFSKHVIFYEIDGVDVLLRRAVDGRRDLPGVLLDAPGRRP